MKEFLENKLYNLVVVLYLLVIFNVDLDKFKLVNDIFGYVVGD